MHKRHGEVVNRVLQEKIAEQSEKLVRGTMDDSSLLALVIGKRHLAKAQDGRTDNSLDQSQNSAMMRLEDAIKLLLAKFPISAPRRLRKMGKLGNRDTVIFAAILLELEGLKYCAFIQSYGVRPKWSESGQASYAK